MKARIVKAREQELGKRLSDREKVEIQLQSKKARRWFSVLYL